MFKTVGLPPIEVELPMSFFFSDKKIAAWAVLLPLLMLLIFSLLWRGVPQVWVDYSKGESSLLAAGMLGGATCLAHIAVSLAWPLYVFMQRRGPVLTISKEGLEDLRVSDDIIPWELVAEGVSLNSPNGGYALKLTLNPSAEISLYGPQGVRNWLLKRGEAAQIIIDTKSLSSRTWIAQQTILYLLKSGRENVVKQEPLSHFGVKR